jgi:diaminohydroxyphosphoribosylaminopyrimidine deaminase / 5-amino-6-(5-phosphoribosylamino)uracil reductase
LSVDSRWMDYALRLGRRAQGTTAENPAVGCVLVKDGRVVGIGCTQPGGRPHAETMAIAMAGEAARGATAYTTLEPCAHHGRTPPCAEALVRAGVARVVTALVDPDPRVAGNGIRILREAGIEVASGLAAGEARRDLDGFFHRILRDRPQAILKLAISADGKIAAEAGRPTAITGEQARARVHLLRAQCDAILVGMGTALADDPALDCRLPGLERRSPRPFVLSQSGQTLPPASRLAQRGAEVLHGPLTVVLPELAGRGINRLLVEGGAQVARSFLAQGLVDEFHLYRAPMVLGPQGVDALAGLPLGVAFEDFTLRETERLGADDLYVYERRERGTIMFTGIVTDIGTVRRVEKRGDTHFVIATNYATSEIDIGASIACAGVCLTVVEKISDSFSVDASAETLSKTTLGTWREGTRVNLERPLRMGDELGGHVVSGHVDGVGSIVSITPEGDSKRVRFRLPDSLARFVAPKGSIAVDGTSLTVNEVEGNEFGVNIIPHTQAVTTWGHARAGDPVNVEIDMLARYVARLAEFGKT